MIEPRDSIIPTPPAGGALGPAPEPEEERHQRRSLKRIGIGLSIAIVLGFFAYWGREYYVLRNFHLTTVAYLRSIEAPWSYEQFERKYYGEPEPEEMIRLYRQAFDALHAVQEDETHRDALRRWGRMRSEDQAAVADDMEATRRAVEACTDVFEWTRQAQAAPQGRFPFDLTLDVEPRGRHLREFQRLKEAHDAAIRVALADGDTARAMAMYAQSAAIGAPVAEEPLLASQLARMAFNARTLDAAEAILSAGPLDGSQLDRLAASVRVPDYALIYAMDGEIAGMLNVRGAGMYRATAEEDLEAIRGHYSNGLRRWFTARFVRGSELNQRIGAVHHLNIVRDAMFSPYPESIAAVEEAVRNAKDGWGYYYAALTLPSYPRAVRAHAHTLARVDAFQCAILIEHYRNAHGAPPPDLEALAPEYLEAIPADPFDGAPLRYRLLETGGYAVYSVADNLRDDGGAPYEWNEGDPRGDMAFTVRR